MIRLALDSDIVNMFHQENDLVCRVASISQSCFGPYSAVTSLFLFRSN